MKRFLLLLSFCASNVFAQDRVPSTLPEIYGKYKTADHFRCLEWPDVSNPYENALVTVTSLAESYSFKNGLKSLEMLQRDIPHDSAAVLYIHFTPHENLSQMFLSINILQVGEEIWELTQGDSPNSWSTKRIGTLKKGLLRIERSFGAEGQIKQVVELDLFHPLVSLSVEGTGFQCRTKVTK